MSRDEQLAELAARVNRVLSGDETCRNRLSQYRRFTFGAPLVNRKSQWPSNPNRSSIRSSCASRCGPSTCRSAWRTGSPSSRNGPPLIASGRADNFKETALLPDFLADIFCRLLGYTGPVGPADTHNSHNSHHSHLSDTVPASSANAMSRWTARLPMPSWAASRRARNSS
jgi:hypothetical protein